MKTASHWLMSNLNVLKGDEETVSWCHSNIITCSTEAPAWRNCSPVSAESIPPVAKIGKPGIALPMAETALRAMGLMALPAHIGDITE